MMRTAAEAWTAVAARTWQDGGDGLETIARRRRLIAVNRFYWPDHSATSQLLTDLAEHLACRGIEVIIITSHQVYDDPGARMPRLEIRHGVTIHRIWGSRFGRNRLAGRAVDYLSFYLASLLALLRLARPGDTILAKTDPPLISVVAWVVARLRRAELVNWCQDLFPEVAAALDLRWAGGPLGRLLGALRDASLRGARINVALCERMSAHLVGVGVPAERVSVVHNWADGIVVRPIPPERNSLRREWGLEGRQVIGYSGNLGRAHALSAVREFVVALRAADPALVFLFVGGGAGMVGLEAWAKSNAVPDILFRPYQPRERLAESLSVPDVHLVSLDPACEGLIMPSKVYGILAAGRPLIVLGDPGGAVAELVRGIDAGVAWTAGRERDALDLLARAAGDVTYRAQIRRTFETRFERAHALRCWEVVLGVTREATVAAGGDSGVTGRWTRATRR